MGNSGAIIVYFNLIQRDWGVLTLRARGVPAASATLWIPAFAGMTAAESGKPQARRTTYPFLPPLRSLRLCVKFRSLARYVGVTVPETAGEK